MKILIISPSTMPTYCGVGKFTDKISNYLLETNNEILVLGQTNQKLKSKLDVEIKYSIELLDLNFKNSKTLIRRIKDFNPDVIILQFNSAEIGKNIYLNFLPSILKIKGIKSQLISVIHEFKTFTYKGKVRNLAPMLLSDKIYFSDQMNLDEAIKFCPLIKNKSEVIKIGPQTGGNYLLPTIEKNNDIINKIIGKKKLKIGFHGLIQPKNNIKSIIESLNQLNLNNVDFEFHILGDFKPLINYGEMQNEVIEFQNSSLEMLKEYNLFNKTIIHGDIDPFDTQFMDIAKALDIAIFPDVDGITSRRTSFWNLFVQSNAICLVSKTDVKLEIIFDNLIQFNILEKNSLTKELITLLESSVIVLKNIIEKQNELRLQYSNENLKNYYYEKFKA
jgi:glycosyltransferase involved in cell wall biosynthesis